MDLITAQPGVHKSEICRVLDISWGTVCHHVDALVAEAVIRGHRIGTRVHYARKGVAHKTRAVRAIMMPHAQEILGLLANTNVLGPSQISNELDISVKVVRTHLTALVGDGVLESDGGYHPRYWLSPVAESLDFVPGGPEPPTDSAHS